MFSKKSKPSGMCLTCNYLSWVYLVIGVLITIAAIVGVIMAHFPAETNGAVFGSISGSLSLVSLVACLFFLHKMGNYCACQCGVVGKK